MSFKFSFTRTQTDEPTAEQVRECIKEGLREIDKKLRRLKRSEPFSIALEVEIEVKPAR